jgi:hypothetical protein
MDMIVNMRCKADEKKEEVRQRQKAKDCRDNYITVLLCSRE